MSWGINYDQRGNVLIAIFAAIAAVGMLGAVGMNVLQGPVRSMAQVTNQTIVKNDLIAASILLSEAALAQSDADCDDDGTIEPLPFKPPGMYSAPTGGGHIPMIIGANKAGPWGYDYGYCVWDHGTQIQHTACGGASANRLRGGDTATAPVIALISAGPDRIFQTSCVDYINENTPEVVRVAGSDDIVHVMPYGQFLLPSKAEAQLTDKPEEACHAETIGTMRITMGMVQVCMDTGWAEVGTSAFSDSNFEPVTNAVPGQQYDSNTISFSGFLNERDIEVTQGNALLLINGHPAGSSAKIKAGDTIALRAHAAGVPEITLTFAISVSGVRKSWTIRTRDYLPAYLTITPASHNLTIATPGSPGYSDPVSFIIRNTGEVATGPLDGAQLSNTDNFEFYSNGSYVGDGCAARDLAPEDFCVIDIRARASNDGTHSGTLTTGMATDTVSATLSLNASGWSCSSPWGGSVAHGEFVTAYQTATVTFGQSCQSQNRNCSQGILDGSYEHQSCAVAEPTYNYGSWGSYGSCSKTCGGGTQTRTRACIRQEDGASVDCSNCGGACSQDQNCNTQTCCTRQPASGYNYSFYSTRWTYSQPPKPGSVSITWNGTAIGTKSQVGNIASVKIGSWTYLRGPLHKKDEDDDDNDHYDAHYGVARTNCP